MLGKIILGVSVNDKPYQGQEEITLGIGELVSVRVELLNSLKGTSYKIFLIGNESIPCHSLYYTKVHENATRASEKKSEA